MLEHPRADQALAQLLGEAGELHQLPAHREHAQPSHAVGLEPAKRDLAVDLVEDLSVAKVERRLVMAQVETLDIEVDHDDLVEREFDHLEDSTAAAPVDDQLHLAGQAEHPALALQLGPLGVGGDELHGRSPRSSPDSGDTGTMPHAHSAIKTNFSVAKILELISRSASVLLTEPKR